MNLLPQGERLLSGQLSAFLSDSATEIDVNNPPNANKLPTYLTIDPDGDEPETVRVIDVSGNTITIERGVYNGGVGSEHQANSPYEQRFIQKDWDAVVDAIESGYLTEDSIFDLTQVNSSSFTISDVDRTDFATEGRRIRLNGNVYCTVASSSFGSGDTTVNIKETTVPASITSLEWAISPQGFAVSNDSLDIRTSPSDLTATGLKADLTAGENLVFGDVCYFKNDGKMWKADADAIATGIAIGMALDTINADASGEFLLMGIVRNDAWNWTVGAQLYLSPTSGEFTETQPSATDQIIQVIAIALTADIIYFKPSIDYMTHT